ncbi:MAG: hypothetical protein ABI315_04685 [Bacteroidia bacterium]
MKTFIIEKWLNLALINLCVLALLGVTLRYKITFSLPLINQQNLLHGHSHFAFSGWVSQALMTLLVFYLQKTKQESVIKRYSWLLFTNILFSYGMLIFFTIQGYAFFSILFSTLCIFVSYIFTIMYWKDLNKLKLKCNSHLWFKAALLFNVISSVGPFILAYMMFNKHLDQNTYLLSVYYYLHFQYNGWFIFACMGLFVSKFNEIIGNDKKLNTIFWIFAFSSIPTYFMAVLWFKIPVALYLLVIVAAIMEVVAWLWFIRIIRNAISELKKSISYPARLLMTLAAISMSIKVILQLGSAYMPLNQLVFGFRPIVIGYLHLVFLGIISIFILGYFVSERMLIINKTTKTGIGLFVFGVFINELFLMAQGITGLIGERFPYINVLLFIAAIVIFTGILILVINNIRTHLLNKTEPVPPIIMLPE